MPREKAAAPSWSWASVEGPVFFHEFFDSERLGRIKFNDVSNQTRGKSLASIEAHPLLHLQGHPVRARWDKNFLKGKELRFAKIVLAGHKPDNLASERKMYSWEEGVRLEKWSEPPPKSIICLPFVHSIVQREIRGMYGLVSTAAPHNTHHEIHATGPPWRRIGLFHSSKPHLISEAQEADLHII